MFGSDICWCIDSEFCNRYDCFRHISHKDPEEKIFTAGYLGGTEYCVEFNEENEKEGE